ncbi:Putative lipoprotein thiredoxin [hydrothermal vent metagenome]|uniref:Putative lipoprotein thiredoxin n=1 Tax=hydrothermal vent metagenome TaxID=652676 RepID=A0A1W1ELA3_9ZZZZ
MRIVFSIYILILLTFVSCSDEDANINREIKKQIIDNNITKEDTNQSTTKPKVSISRDEKINFTLTDFDQNSKYSKKFTVYKEGIDFKNITQNITILHFLSTKCKPCIGQIPYLSDLQSKYRKDIFLMGVVVDDNISNSNLKEFANKNNAIFFLSNNNNGDKLISTISKQLGIEKIMLPLTIIYKRGAYYIHYEGSAPIEMIESDILQALEKK